ncbi:pirin family protein [Parvularcula oceani]|uniref:pirin family protein n=1 Tax=Parvularcula oceani TaxID=1247963 RepID=UPI00068A8ED9|nr:pirin family protein [Parvularcula oceani]
MSSTPQSAAGKSRRIVKISQGMPTSDGAGVKLTRMMGHQGLPDLDPFLMLDQFRSDDADDYIAGFPNHPHRGFETVTVMLDGRMRHGDSRGNSGVVGPGGVQWMTAGSGLVHSEIPEQEDGLMWGFQLWLNLPAARKMTEPGWQDIPEDDIPVETREGAAVRVIAGETSGSTRGPARSAAPETDVRLFDVRLEPGASFAESLPEGHNAFVAVYGGEVRSQGGDREVAVAAPNLGVLSREGHVALEAGPEGARFLLVAGRPIEEPVARYGPFVMNTRAELQQAVDDFRAGHMG